MQLLTTTILALLSATSTFALPPTPLASRDGITLTFYGSLDYTGEPFVVSNIPANECQYVPAPIKGKIGSIQLADGALCRLTYTAESCTIHGDAFLYPKTSVADAHHFTDPATGDVVDMGAELTSFLCQGCTACNE